MSVHMMTIFIYNLIAFNPGITYDACFIFGQNLRNTLTENCNS